MAGANQNTPIVGVYTKIQEIIAEYIGGLEKNKLDEAVNAVKALNESNQEKTLIENKILQVKKDLETLNTSKIDLEAEIVLLKTAKEVQNNELVLVKKDVSEQKALKIVLDEEKTNANKIIQEASTRLDEIEKKEKEKSTKITKLDTDILTKTNELSEINKKLIENKKISDELDKKIENNKVLLEDYSLKNQEAIKTLNKCKEDTVTALESKTKADKELELHLVDVENKKTVANNELKNITDQVDAFKVTLEQEKLAIENEKSFNKQVSDLNTQKSKSLEYAQSKLKETIIKLTLEADDTKKGELKNLLFVIEKL